MSRLAALAARRGGAGLVASHAVVHDASFDIGVAPQCLDGCSPHGNEEHSLSLQRPPSSVVGETHPVTAALHLSDPVFPHGEQVSHDRAFEEIASGALSSDGPQKEGV